MNPAERSMGIGLRALNRIAGLELLDRIGARERVERILHSASRNGFRAANAAGRTFVAAQKLRQPARQPRGERAGLFDITPTDEQQMMREAVGDFALERLRPAAQDADSACEAPAELLAQGAELGLTMLGVPEELGGVLSERSAVTSVLVAEQLARGDMGLAFASLAPAAVSTAIGLWGDAEQQATYLPEFTGSEPPAAALALLEPRPLFDPFGLRTVARPKEGGFVLTGVKSLVPRVAEAEVFVVAADLPSKGPALFIVESKTAGLAVEPEPAMGLRPAATGRLLLDDVRVDAGALLGDASPDVYAECVRLGRIGWCALAVGAAQAVLDYVTEYVNERKAFGEPISNRQAVAFNVADIAIELEGMRLATYRAAGRIDQGHDHAREAATARTLCAAKGMKIGSDGVQLLGGHGYVKEHPVERWYRDLRAAGLMEGGLLV
jgi:alkylation response protein AidB-like acyl-CoA dehydrogenase